jgi:hypothetical protein
VGWCVKEQRKTLAEILGDFAMKPASHTHNDPEHGYSCLGFCYSVLKAMGKNPPYEYQGISIDNFEQLCPSGKPETFEKLKEASRAMGSEVNPDLVLAGDYILLEDRRGHVFPGIYAGNGQAMVCFEFCGVRSFTISGKAKIIMARRL